MTTHGFSKSRLERAHEVMLGHVASGDVRGVVYAMHRGETEVDAVGAKAFGTNDAMAVTPCFRIASVTKPIAAVAALTLVEECKISSMIRATSFLRSLKIAKF
jgi:CubicO group peptidase (beta-lactamase class C family)